MSEIVLALGFDLFFKPKMNAAADQLGLTLRYAKPEDAAAQAADATRVVADASSPGVADALEAVRAAHPTLPILACYPHVQADLGARIANLGGTPTTRGAFNAALPDALAGKWKA